MLSSLKRVLRIRALQEESRRMTLEAEAGRLREIESGSVAAAQEARQNRERSFAEMGGRGAESGGLTGGESADARCESGQAPAQSGPGTGGNWREAEAGWEAAVRRRGSFEARRPAQEGSVDRARTEFLEGRRERLQAESLVEAASAERARERGRGEQRGLDEWFQSWARRIREREES